MAIGNRCPRSSVMSSTQIIPRFFMLTTSGHVGLHLQAPRNPRMIIVGCMAALARAAAACGHKLSYLELAPRPRFGLGYVPKESRQLEAGPATVVNAELSEWKISLPTDTISAGPVTIEVH